MLPGTSSFAASGWNGSFYPKGMRPADYLASYAEHFYTVEVDSTVYACPSVRTVESWKHERRRTLFSPSKFCNHRVRTVCRAQGGQGTEEVVKEHASES